ncbi:GNAT family N-acetyltransferase [Aspergillus tanneri]|uniref:N-acetyltransferase domain-containing protein n=1 Tax=Aspergillus tanneri TaxID=1220188 RepID=A0A5M9MR08_9EURO|nr:uncharacterized protein ATNIH1004_009208 [Aspergillus tanneri]KAA8644997.1 hypothetical protein ATNIH1004_009208 [Aspergillus tanneri]
MSSLKAVDGETGEILGYIVFTRRQPTPQKTKESDGAEEPKGPDGVDTDVLMEVTQAINIITKDVKAIERYELVYMCVKQSSRRRGIGSALVQRCFERAKSEGLPVAVCAEPAAYEFYVNSGFKETKYADTDLARFAPAYSGYGMFRLTGMIWYP